MKAIMVMFDSLNRKMLPPYGCDWTSAPNFARLAEKTVVFEQCYAGSMPCMPARRELHTGRYNFLHRSWGPIEPFDDSMPELLKEHGVYSHLCTDHYHYFEDGGSTYHTRYCSWEFARGQEGDPWKGNVRDPQIPQDLYGRKGLWIRQNWVNRCYMQKEEDQSQAVTFQYGLEFIRANVNEDNWFLQIETFDPHEPFFSPQKYKDLYPHDYKGPHHDWPPYQRVTEPPELVEHVRFEYAALLSMCDEYLGKVIDLMDELDLWKDTMLIVNTDHGFLLGEHGWWAKCTMPFYDEIIHTPLFIWDPRSQIQGEHRKSLVQTIDLAPTLLEYFGVDIPPNMQGKPLRQSIALDQPVRAAALFGIHGGHVNCTDGRYVYMRAPKEPENSPLYDYTLMPTRHGLGRAFIQHEKLETIELAEPFPFTKGLKTMKINSRAGNKAPFQYPTLLFDLEKDPPQNHPIQDELVEQQMIGHLVRLMKENDAPEEQWIRLGLEGEMDV